MMTKILSVLFLVVIAMSCTKKAPTLTAAQSHDKMVQELDSLYKNGNGKEYYHWNTKRAHYYKDLIKDKFPEDDLQNFYLYCLESLNAGDTQTTINALTDFLGDLKEFKKERLVFYDLLAISYLRKGEQDNCVYNHTAQSCIYPIQKEGRHVLKDGSVKAIELYTLLYNQTTNTKYLWLLNVAHSTLGTQEKLPSKYLLPTTIEVTDFPKFEDRAMHLGLAQNGLSGGVIIDDFNNDGKLDVFTTSYGMNDNVQLYLNEGSNRFKNVTKKAGLTGITGGLNCMQADYDNDGFVDMLVLRGGWLGDAGAHPNSLLKNMGNGTFKDVTHISGIYSRKPTQTAAWADVNQDGFLDVFIGNETSGFKKQSCELYINQQDGTFKEEAVKYGLGNINRFVKGVHFGDINNDNWPDLYVSCMNFRNFMYLNEKGTFKEIAMQAGVSQPVNSFPCWFWDINNDGYDDLFVASYDVKYQNNAAGIYANELRNIPNIAQTTKLYINNKNLTFTDVSKAYGIDKPVFAMGANFGDLDNDGHLDFYLGTGAPDLSTVVPNRMFKNENGTTFKEVTYAGNFGHIQKGHGVAFADLDSDGDQDIYAVMGGAYEGDTFTNVLFENPIAHNNWNTIRLEGTSTNKSGTGVKLKAVLSNGNVIYRTVNSGGSFGASPLQAHFGLGTAAIDRLYIYWRNGKVQELKNLTGNRVLKIKENGA